MDIRTQAVKIVKKLVEAGHIAYFAGGWVRDLIMGHPSSDIDIATSAQPDEIIKLFPKTIPVGIAFGVVIVLVNKHQFEVSTFRKDFEYIDGRRPIGIEPSTPEEDAKRRDFTINGMFFDPLTDNVLDYIGGQDDIRKKVIRTIGDPKERFGEDRLRMIRAVRFATRFAFSIDPATREAIKEFAPTLLPAVSIERIWQEINKMAESPHFGQSILEMHRLGLLQNIFPNLVSLSEAELKMRIGNYVHFPKKSPPILLITELFPKATPEELQKLCEYLKVSNQDAKLAAFTSLGRTLIETKADDCAWAHYYADARSQIAIEAIAARYATEDRKKALNDHLVKKQRLEHHIQRIVRNTPLVNAQMLMDLGIKPGKLLGELLRDAEIIAINRDFHDSQEVIKILRQSEKW